MKQPVLAVPLDESEKKLVFEDIGNYATKDSLLDSYINAFIKKNDLGNCAVQGSLLKKLYVSIAISVIAALEVVYLALYHARWMYLLLVIELIVLLVLMKKQDMTKYLHRQVILRPDDDIDNILTSQVSGVKKGLAARLFMLIPPLVVLIASLIVFMRPHMIFEKTRISLSTATISIGESRDAYSLRYYTLSLLPDKSVVVPETYKGRPVVEIRGQVFEKMPSLRHITLPSGITEIRGSTFEGCTNLQEIDIPEGVTRIAGHAFYGCRSLRKVSVPSTVKSIGSSAFRRCSSLMTITIPATTSVDPKAFKESPTVVTRR